MERGSELTVGQLAGLLLDGSTDLQELPLWPPDAFAVAACLLHRSGAYVHVVRKWPPGDDPTNWSAKVERLGDEWRDRWMTSVAPPAELRRLWRDSMTPPDLSLSEISRSHERCSALAEICAAADEACRGIGVPGGRSENDDAFERRASLRLADDQLGSSLCERIHPSKIRVLPKMHTPQSGVTVRSLSHNIAIVQSADIEPVWTKVATDCGAFGERANLLLIPWPTVVRPSDFVQVEQTQDIELRNMPTSYGFFEYQPPRGPLPDDTCDRILTLIKRAEELLRRVDGVVLPEVALTTEQYEGLAELLSDPERLRDAGITSPAIFLVSGVRGADSGSLTNQVGISVPLIAGEPFSVFQGKHHRWCLNKAQIIQYGIGSSLDPRLLLWEHVRIDQRRLHFVAMQSWLTMSVLLCEDLARQDPAAEVVRAVGPNLVIALLMDGPQLPERWSARYATVLADDPGSSVLTLTSIGMATISKPPGVQESSRVVALWKDGHSGTPRQILLPHDADAVVISLAAEWVEEFSADGRGDGGSTAYPILVGVHAVSRS